MLKTLIATTIILTGCGVQEMGLNDVVSHDYLCYKELVFQVTEHETYTESILLVNEDNGSFYDCNLTVDYSDFE